MEIVLSRLRFIPLRPVVDDVLRSLRFLSNIKLPGHLSQIEKSVVHARVALFLLLGKNVERGTGSPKLVNLKGNLKKASVYLVELTKQLPEGCYNFSEGSAIQLVITGECPFWPHSLILANHGFCISTITCLNSPNTDLNAPNTELNSYGILYRFGNDPINSPLSKANVVVEQAGPGRLDPDAMEETLRNLAAAA